MKVLNKYKKIVGKDVIEKLRQQSQPLYGKHILNINSTYQGGGVAEILNSLIPLMNELGVNAGWRILHGSVDFFKLTKKLTNALQGEPFRFTPSKEKVYIENLKKFSTFTHIDHDLVVIHDTQPLGLISFYNKKQPWVWRCHTDISQPNKHVYNYIRKYIRKYDLMVVLSENFLKELSVEQKVMPPSIDPLSNKNKPISERMVCRCLEEYGINQRKPIILQVSRFDIFKDPMGVLKIFKKVRQKVNCQLVLIGSVAMDDPECSIVYKQISKIAKKKDVTLINEQNDLLVNALQRAASVVIQKSKREGFGLTVTEAMWKGTPVVASNVGGIKDQIRHGKNGFLVEPANLHGFTDSIIKLLKDEKLRGDMGKFGKEYVRQNFLITTHLMNWINILNEQLGKRK
ncbi:MAG: glycosyltransferase [archaeon]